MKIALVLLFIASWVMPALGQSVYLTGRIHDLGSPDGIAGASLSILGTSRGAKANLDGDYRLALDRGETYRIRVTSYSYRPDTLTVRLSGDSVVNVGLRPAPVFGRTITVTADASRKEAHRIIQKVIDTKDVWQSAIHDYRFQVYARLNMQTLKDTSKRVLGILESIADGYWKQDKGYAERITAREQTANIPASLNRATLFDVDNFYNERIDFEEYSVTGPVAHDAFDRYDYDLIGEGELNGVPVYKISVEPSSALFPAFQGTLWIDKSDYAIAYLELAPNDAIHLGPIKNISISQTFSVVNNKYWMPSQLSFGFSIKLEMPFLPQFHFEQNAVLQNYTINGGVPDSIFLKEHLVEPLADSVDSLHWTAMRAIPLAASEAVAYRTFDSVAALPVIPRSHSALDVLFDFISPIDCYTFDRVEGSRFQIEHSFTVSESWPLTLGGSVAYGLGDKRWKYDFSFDQGLTWTTRNAISASLSLGGGVAFNGVHPQLDVTSGMYGRVYDSYVRRGTAYGPLVNTLTALLLHSDYPDYYRARGFEVGINVRPLSHLSLNLQFTNEDEQSLPNVTDYSILSPHDHYRDNPTITDGRLHALNAGAGIDFTLGNWDGTASILVVYSSPGIGSEFDFTTASADLTVEGATGGGLGRTWLHLQEGQVMNGVLPPQQLFYFESRNVVLAPRDVFRTMSPLEYQLDKDASVQFEQDVYDLPTRLAGIHLPVDLQWFGFANLALGDGALASRPYLEAGFGIGNILNLLRFDATWRVTHRTDRNFFVTGTLAISF